MRTLTTLPLMGIIANPTSLENRADLIKELGEPHDGYLNPLKFSFKEFAGEIVPLDIQPNEILSVAGFEKGKKAMFKAVEYLVGRGAKIICFTASTKRLSGKFGQEVKKLYPDVIFTIGDNATMISFVAILDHFLTTMNQEKDIVVCVGAGFLGNQAIKEFLRHEFKNIILLSEQKINCFPEGITVVNSLEKLPGNIKLLAACSHKYELDPPVFKKLFAPSAVIVDVCVPPLVKLNTYQVLPKDVRRYDAGDFFLPSIEYSFEPKILNFPEAGFWYGCFTELVMLNLALRDGYDLSAYNFFEINQKNYDLLKIYLKRERVYIPFINFYNMSATYSIRFE